MAEVVAGADRFRRIREAQRGITARRVTQQSLAALRRMGDVLGGVLPPREFVAVAASVVQTLAERIAGMSLLNRRKQYSLHEELGSIFRCQGVCVRIVCVGF